MSTTDTASPLYRCTEPFVDYANGRDHVRIGRIVTADSALMQGREHMFTPVVADDASTEVRAARRPPEQATAAPGEHRSAVIPRDQADEQGRVERSASPETGELSPVEAAGEVGREDDGRPGYTCPEDGCEFHTESKAGLSSHRRTHQ